MAACIAYLQKPQLKMDEKAEKRRFKPGFRTLRRLDRSTGRSA
jgi:hypothetical protein